MSQKILIVTAAFYPENSPRSFRATELAKEFSNQGHGVTLITVPRNHEQEVFCKERNIVLKHIHRLVFRDIVVSSGILGLIMRGLKRLLLMLFEYPEIEFTYRFKQVLQKESGYDLLISIAAPYPVHWGVAWARTTQHQIATTWVADCGDPYMGNESDSFKRLFYFGWIEKWMFRKVDKIAIPIETARSAYYKEFHTKISVIPQGVNFDEFKLFCNPYQENQVVSFAYAGTFIAGKRDPRKLLDYLISLPSDFRFYIYTGMHSWLSEYERLSKGRIIFKPYVSRKELIGILSQMDFLVNIENSTTTQAPSKLIDYYISGRPVLAVTSDDPRTEVVDSFFEKEYSKRYRFENFDKYRIQSVCDQFLTLITK